MRVSVFYFIFLCLKLIFGNNISLDYFVFKEVKSLCFITCDDSIFLTKHFAKEAIDRGISISIVNLRQSLHNEKLKKCLNETLSITVGILLHDDCQKFQTILNLASQNLYFSDSHKWLIVSNSNNLLNGTIFGSEYYYNDGTDSINNNVISVLRNCNISVDADIAISIMKDNEEYNLYEAYKFGHTKLDPLIITKIGNWRKATGLNMFNSGYKYYRRWDFQQWTMKMIVVFTPKPHNFKPIMVTDYEHPVPGTAMMSRATSTMLNVIADTHNIRYNYTLTDRWIGQYLSNSSRAVLTALYFREQDITPILRLNKDVTSRASFLLPSLLSIETRYFYKIPTNGIGKYENEFLTPFSSGVWGCMLGAMALCGTVLLLSAVYEHRPSSFQYAVFSVIASICQQFYEDIEDNSTKRISTARKLAVLVTGVSCVLIYNYYTSSVVSWLLSGPPPSLNSLQELLESPLELIYEDIGYTRTWMQYPEYYFNKRNAKVEDEMRKKKVLNKKRTEPIYQTLDKGIEMVKSGGYAYHTDTENANRLISKTFTQSELCELGSLVSMDKTLLYAVLPKRSSYQEFFNWNLKRLQETGVIDCIKKRTMASEVTCAGSSPRALALGGAAPAFLLLASGFIVAIVILFIERYWHSLVVETIQDTSRKVHSGNWQRVLSKFMVMICGDGRSVESQTALSHKF